MTIREQHWLDEALPDELRRVLEHARDAQAESAQVARLRGRLAEAGPLRARSFSWESTARATLDALRSAIAP